MLFALLCRLLCLSHSHTTQIKNPPHLTPNKTSFDFGHLPDDEPWWWHGETGDPKAVHYEPDHAFDGRMDALRDWLLARPERSIGVVAHWGVLLSLTGAEFENCELRTVGAHELL